MVSNLHDSMSHSLEVHGESSLEKRSENRRAEATILANSYFVCKSMACISTETFGTAMLLYETLIIIVDIIERFREPGLDKVEG